MKEYIFISVLIVSIMMSGCIQPETTPPSATPTPVQSPTATATPIVVQSPTVMPESGVHRSISKTTLSPGEQFTVTIDIMPGEGITYWLFSDTYPKEVIYVSNEGGTFSEKSHQLKEVELSDMSDQQFTVTAQAPAEPGTYQFSGMYYFENDKDGEPISGDDTIVVG